jgi:hypothetical protein
VGFRVNHFSVGRSELRISRRVREYLKGFLLAYRGITCVKNYYQKISSQVYPLRDRSELFLQCSEEIIPAVFKEFFAVQFLFRIFALLSMSVQNVSLSVNENRLTFFFSM